MIKSLIAGNGARGIELISGSNVRIKKNNVLANFDVGFYTFGSGSGNVISKNLFIGHFSDIRDLGGAPCANTYSNNVFGTADPGIARRERRPEGVELRSARPARPARPAADRHLQRRSALRLVVAWGVAALTPWYGLLPYRSN